MDSIELMEEGSLHFLFFFFFNLLGCAGSYFVHVGPSSLTKDELKGPCMGSMADLGHQTTREVVVLSQSSFQHQEDDSGSPVGESGARVWVTTVTDICKHRLRF